MSRRDQRKDLFHGWFEEGAPVGKRAALLRRAVTARGGQRFAVSYGSAERIGPGASKPLAEYREDELLGLLLADQGELDLVAIPIEECAERHFGRPIERTWTAVLLRTDTDLQLATRHRPGDIDLLFGPWVDGRPAFDWIAGIEVKRRITKTDGAPASAPSGFGSTQAGGLLRHGCDLAFLCHILVARHPAESNPLEAYVRPDLLGPDQTRTMNATADLVRARLPDGVGYFMLAWAHGLGYSPMHHGAAEALPYRCARPISGTPEPARRRLRERLGQLFERFPEGSRMIARCVLCDEIIAVRPNVQQRCPHCRRVWFPVDAPPPALDA